MRERELVAIIVTVIGGVALLLSPPGDPAYADAGGGMPEGSPDNYQPDINQPDNTTTCTYVDACAATGDPGCPGDPGMGGSGGWGAGASVPLFISGGTVTIRGGALIAGSGGIGGAGGGGGPGAPGVTGDAGNPVFCDLSCGTASLAGGFGGAGGPGGSGGQGGGGAGGPVCYYANVGGMVLIDASPQEILEGDGGAGGAPNGPPGAFKAQCP